MQKVCKVSNLELNTAKRILINDFPVAIIMDSFGKVHAIGDTCTHGEVSLSEGFLEGDTIECWAHGAKFSIKTGEALSLPAYEPVPVFLVEVKDGDILVDIDIKIHY